MVNPQSAERSKPMLERSISPSERRLLTPLAAFYRKEALGWCGHVGAKHLEFLTLWTWAMTRLGHDPRTLDVQKSRQRT